MVVARPMELEPPCDTDTTVLEESECSGFPAEAVTYFTCESVENTYIGTVGKISDTRCPGEDRLLQCELENGAATSNINEGDRFKVLNSAFLKSYIDENVSYSFI